MNKRELLKSIYNDTLEYTQEIITDKSIELSQSIKLDMNNKDIINNYPKKFISTNIQVFNQDVITTTINLHNKIKLESNKNIMVLNLASKKKFGGGVANGSMAQEEELFRKTSYGLHYGSNLYPLNLEQFVVTPSVYIIKDEFYNRLESENIFQVDMIAISALNNPKQINGIMRKPDYYLTFKKIESIFKYALLNGNENLVLGALGCGVFRNPPLQIIEIFNTCIKKYNGFFNNIFFSVKSINDSNYELFNKHIDK